ncbi:tRNA (adenosine(37)-N6)-dimethylallyltransferase MiaA [Candidatus Parcubacteria bacterium]|nr:tRNA (adenosine(37)-N6)-dimethylallyltransferase MiaA [Candidatus Parcubacteria bacterium]
MKKSKIVAIVGPTASGKSGLAVRLARTFNGEVISADSRQVYTGLDIGTGKVSKREMRDIPHHLLDVLSPRRQFSAARYKLRAEKAVGGILRRGHLPIVCGGTGHYLETLTKGTVLPEVRPNLALRKKLNKKSAKELYSLLKKLDPRRARGIDEHNPRRLVRAIEIAKALGSVPKLKVAPKYDVLQIGLALSPAKLKNKIQKRLRSRMKEGMVTEAKRLRQEGLSLKRMDELGLEYRYLAKHLDGEMTREEMAQKLETEIWRYSKRQMIWFKRDKTIKWFSPSEYRKVREEVGKFIKNGRR